MTERMFGTPRTPATFAANYVVERLGDPSGDLVLDETGFIKKGTHSVGVGRQ